MPNIVTFTPIPITDPDIPSPFRGGESWHNDWQAVKLPTEANPVVAMDVYWRSFYTWAVLEPTQGSYNFAPIKKDIETAIDNKQRYSFSIMSLFPDDTTNASPVANSVKMSYPLYLHTAMQAEAVKDWKAPMRWDGVTITGNWWVPNYNSNTFLSRWAALHAALSAFFTAGTYKGIKYTDAIGYIAIGGYGSWQEGHHHPFIQKASAAEGTVGAWPVGMTPKYQSLNRMIDIYLTNYPNHQLIAEMGWFDARGYENTWNPIETASYIFTVSNNFGKLGWRRDNWNTTWYAYALEDNTRFSVNGVVGNTLIMNRWREAPIGGETYCDGSDMADLKREILQYGASTVGNGNWCITPTETLKTNYREAMKYAGYRVELLKATTPSTATIGQSFTIQTEWRNVGNAPVYEKWVVTFELQNSLGVVVWSGQSSFNIRLWYPGPTVVTTIIDTFLIPNALTKATYDLVVKIKDPLNYRQPLPLAIIKRHPDGGYSIASVKIT